MSNVKTLIKQSVDSIAWNYGAFALSKVVIFISTVILARILVPEQFGLMALGLLAINYLDSLSDFGVGAALIYRQENPERTANVAFYLSFGVGILLASLAFFGAPLVAAFFREPQVTPVLQILSISFLISGFTNIQESLVKKELKFRRRFVAEIGKSVAKGGVSVGMAFAGYGVWSLVWGQLAGGVVSAIIYWWISSWRPRFTFDFKIARSLINYGSQIVLLGLLSGIFSNIDFLIIGRRMDTTQLGYYTMAFRLPELIIMSLCYVVSQVLFPAYAKLQNDMTALRTGFLTTLCYVAVVTMPLGVGMFIVTPEFVQVFYTERWAPVIPVMQMLSVYALISTLSFNVGDIYKAIGRPYILNYISIIKVFLIVPVLWIAAGYNIFYVAVGQVLVILIMTSIRFAIASHILSIRFIEILMAFKPAGYSVLVMVLGMICLRTQLDTLEPIIRLLLLFFSGGTLYCMSLWIGHREIVLQATQLLLPLREKEHI